MSITALVGSERLCELSINTAAANMIEVENASDPITKKKAKEDLKASIFSAYRDCEGHLTMNEVTEALVNGTARSLLD